MFIVIEHIENLSSFKIVIDFEINWRCLGVYNAWIIYKARMRTFYKIFQIALKFNRRILNFDFSIFLVYFQEYFLYSQKVMVFPIQLVFDSNRNCVVCFIDLFEMWFVVKGNQKKNKKMLPIFSNQWISEHRGHLHSPYNWFCSLHRL